ncbi:Uncharacterized protein Adt_39952 [Abeliophyllum distichum]|uniref:Uncharacterized protein n=1 Tax=Abeliophyllum distichum TaxID=126358 RepID=A0ABD1Q6I7_9LAMI
MLGHGSPVSPNPHAGHTSHQTGPTPSQSIQLTATLSTAPSEAAAFSTGRAPVGAPSSGEQFDRSFDHSLAPANLGSGQTPFNLSSRRWPELVIAVWVLGEMEAEIRNWWPDIDKFVGVCCGCGGDGGGVVVMTAP